MDSKFLKLFSSVFLVLFIFSFGAEAAKEKNKAKVSHKSNCRYCEKYEKIKDWPEDVRPAGYIYEKIEYPEGMFRKETGKNEIAISRKLAKQAGTKVYQRLVKRKSGLNKYPELMIRDLAYYEALFNERLNDPKTKVETLESLKRGRDSIRASLQISSRAKTSEAVLKYWSVGKLMKKAKIKKKKKKEEQKIDPEIAERASLLATLKNQINSVKVNSHHAVAIEAQKQIDKLTYDVGNKKVTSEILKNASNQGTKQLTIDIEVVIKNLKEATDTLDTAKTETGKALDATLVAVSKVMVFAKESSTKERFTLSMQSLLLVENAIDLALGSLPAAKTLDISKIDFAKDFLPEELAALSNVVGDLSIAKLSFLQRISGQISLMNAQGFDSIGMMNALEEKNVGIGEVLTKMAKVEIINMKAALGSEKFSMAKFDSVRFAQLTVDKIGMSPTLRDFQTGAAITSIGIPKVSEKLTNAFTSEELDIASIMSDSIGMISSAISGKPRESTKSEYLICLGKKLKKLEWCKIVGTMIEKTPLEIEVPKNVPDSAGHNLANLFFNHATKPSVPGVVATTPTTNGTGEMPSTNGTGETTVEGTTVEVTAAERQELDDLYAAQLNVFQTARRDLDNALESGNSDTIQQALGVFNTEIDEHNKLRAQLGLEEIDPSDPRNLIAWGINPDQYTRAVNALGQPEEDAETAWSEAVAIHSANIQRIDAWYRGVRQNWDDLTPEEQQAVLDRNQEERMASVIALREARSIYEAAVGTTEEETTEEEVTTVEVEPPGVVETSCYMVHGQKLELTEQAVGYYINAGVTVTPCEAIEPEQEEPTTQQEPTPAPSGLANFGIAGILFAGVLALPILSGLGKLK